MLLLVAADNGDREIYRYYLVELRLCVLFDHADLHFHTSVGYMHAIQPLYISYILASWL